ncbi:Organ specific protein [Sesbania bispinosa]|nr:Organ specific protein [Sesbania bispinosa]
MKSIFALFVLFSLLLAANLSYARKDQGNYWKNMMNGQPMPEAIKNLLVKDQIVSDVRKDQFIRDFDIKPNVILYHTHTHVVSKEQKQKEKEQTFVKSFEPEFQGTGRHG